jgi:hypothetical protein
MENEQLAVFTIQKKQVKIWLIVIDVLIALTFVPWLAVAGLSVMAFDSGVSFMAILFVGLMWSYPLVAIFFCALAWILYARKKYKMAALIPFLSFLPGLLLVLLFSLSSIFSGQ